MSGLILKCIEDEDMALNVEEQESNDGAPAVFFGVGDEEEGVLLSDRSVNQLIEWLESWRVKNKGKAD
jgi:hypothetical protein